MGAGDGKAWVTVRNCVEMVSLWKRNGAGDKGLSGMERRGAALAVP